MHWVSIRGEVDDVKIIDFSDFEGRRGLAFSADIHRDSVNVHSDGLVVITEEFYEG